MTQTLETAPKKERVVKTPEQKEAELQAKLEAQKKRVEKAREKAKKLEQKLKEFKQPKINRKQETRIKILHGAAIMAMMKQDDVLSRKVTEFLNLTTKRESDRKMLGLDAVENPSPNETDKDEPKIINDESENSFSWDNMKKNKTS